MTTTVDRARLITEWETRTRAALRDPKNTSRRVPRRRNERKP